MDWLVFGHFTAPLCVTWPLMATWWQLWSTGTYVGTGWMGGSCDLASRGYVVAAVEHSGYWVGGWVDGWMDGSCDLASHGYVHGDS